MDSQALLSCFAIAALATAVWSHLPSRLVEKQSARRILLGVMLGLGAVASMHAPLEIQQGLIMDLRGPLIGTAAFIGGPVSALLAAGLALLYRLSLGGIGVWAGCANIMLASGVGMAAHAIMAGRRAGPLDLLLLATAIAATSGVSVLLLPQEIWAATFRSLQTVTALSFCSTLFFVLSLQRDEQLRALLKQDAMYRAIIEALPDSLNAKDRDSRFIAANPATAGLLGAVSSADLIGKTDADFYSPEMAKLFRDEDLDVLRNTVFGPVDQDVCFADGSRRWLTSLKTPLRDAHGRVIGIITHSRDVTDRRRLEAELLKTQRYLQEAMAHMADGLVLYDQDGTIRFCNQQYRNMFPKTAELRIEGARLADLVRTSVLRGEEAPKADLDAYVAQRISILHHSGEELLELQDGRSLELRRRAFPGSDTLVVFTDVTAKKQVERELRRRASQDPLTSLDNRAAFEFNLQAVHRQSVDRHGAYAVMMLDLDRFKPVNDTFGHAVGDRLLIEVAERLRRSLREGMLVARLGGDEFAFLITGDDVETLAISLANRLVKSLKAPFRTDEIELVPGGSIGIAYFPKDAADPFELLRLADKALYAMKTQGGGGWAISACEGEMRGPPRAKEAAKTAA